MPKRFLVTLALLAVALFSGSAYAQQGIVPGPIQCDGNSNNSIPYNTAFFANCAYQQFHAPAEFCTNPVDFFTGGPYTPSGLTEPALIGGLGLRSDYSVSNIFTGTHTRPDGGTFHFLTDMQVNGNLIYFQDSINWNATTVTYPGGFTLLMENQTLNVNCTTRNTREFQPITSIAAPFTYLGTLTGCCGSCPAPSQGGFLVGFRGISGSVSGSNYLYNDAGSTPFGQRAPGIHVSHIRLYGIGRGADGFTGSFSFYYGLVYNLGGAPRCETYSDLYDDILNAIIVGNPPSDPPFDSTEGGPYYKHDSGIGGIRNSLWKKGMNSEAAFNRGQFNSAGNGLGAMMGEIDAQDGKHLDTDSAGDLRLCIRGLTASLGLSLNGGR